MEAEERVLNGWMDRGTEGGREDWGGGRGDRGRTFGADESEKPVTE